MALLLLFSENEWNGVPPPSSLLRLFSEREWHGVPLLPIPLILWVEDEEDDQSIDSLRATEGAGGPNHSYSDRKRRNRRAPIPFIL